MLHYKGTSFDQFFDGTNVGRRWAIRNKRGSIIPDVSKDSNYYPARTQTRSQITVPIISREAAIGALVLESDELDHFKPTDLNLLTIFSGRAAIAIRNAQLYEDSVKKQRLESDLVVASKVQQTLLPKRFPTIEGLNIEVLNIPSQIVGGDLYDVFRIGDDPCSPEFIRFDVVVNGKAMQAILSGGAYSRTFTP